jgi:hypothetical protein
MVLGSPYVYDMKAIFYMEHNKYHVFKDGIEFIVRAHQMKTNLTIVTIGHMLVNASIQDQDLQPMVERKESPLVYVVLVKKGKHVDGSLFFASVYSVFLLSFMLVSGVWLVVATMNDRVCEFKEMVHLVSNVVSVFVITMMSHVLIIQVVRMYDTRQVGRNNPHFISE